MKASSLAVSFCQVSGLQKYYRALFTNPFYNTTNKVTQFQLLAVLLTKVKSDHRSKFFFCFTAMITLHFHLQPQYKIIMNFIYISQHCLRSIAPYILWMRADDAVKP